MNIATPWLLKPMSQTENPELPIHRYVQTHSEALRNAARLLGGENAVSIVEEIVDALCRDPLFSRSTIHQLGWLEELLFLQNVGDPDRIEAGLFALIDPVEPVVEDICLLADGLREVLMAAAAAQKIESENTQYLAHPSHSSPVQAMGEVL
ncbi:MAG: hypothetical protein ACSHXW_19180 [Yoonia sp.]